MSEASDPDEIPLAYASICDGLTVFPDSFGGEVFIKHPNQRDQIDYIHQYNIFVAQSEDMGVLKKERQIQEAADQGWWSKSKEAQIEGIRFTINRLEQTKKNLIYDSDKRRLGEQVAEQSAQLESLLTERSSYVSLTAEEWASKKTSDYFIHKHFYADSALKKNFFPSVSDFEMCNEETIDFFTLLYYKYMEKMSENQIKKVALSPLFQNICFISEQNCHSMFGRSVVEATTHQIDMLFYGKYFNSIIKNAEGKVPEELYKDPDKFVEWSESSTQKRELIERSSKRGSGNSGSGSTFLFGERSDIENMGLEVSGDKIISETKVKGGMSFQDSLEK